jgi:hypothetical protein
MFSPCKGPPVPIVCLLFLAFIFQRFPSICCTGEKGHTLSSSDQGNGRNEKKLKIRESPGCTEIESKRVQLHGKHLTRKINAWDFEQRPLFARESLCCFAQRMGREGN